MALYLRKKRSDILRDALRKVEKNSNLTATGPGSVLRALIEGVTSEIGDLFDAMDFNLSQSVLSTAQGRALDLMGSLYNVRRRELSQTSTLTSTVGAFYFYIESAYVSDIIIPVDTTVYTSTDDFIGRQFTYKTTESITIPAGQTYAYVGIRPKFTDSVFTAGASTLVVHDFVGPVGVSIQCRNAKPIPPQMGFELDNDYRLRIIKSIRVTASGTPEAIRFKALSYEGVRDARVVQHPYGLGSFKLLIVPEKVTNGAAVVRSMVSEIREMSPAGSVMFLSLPDSLPFDMSTNLTVSNSVNASTKERIRARSKTIIERYLNNLLPGDTIVYNRLVSLIFASSSEILDVQVTSFAANGTEVIRKNYTPNYDQQIVPAGITVTTSN
jgi:hypothetical protein